jgi:5-methylcytosine-specific restriction endonuclease McrA
MWRRDGCSGGLDPHHIHFKGAGGADTKENLITLCRKHHDEAQARKIPAAVLQSILNALYGYPISETE